MILLLVAAIVIAWIVWSAISAGSLRQMNAGARLFQQKRYSEAEAHFRQLLTRRLAPGVEADMRRRFADTLDVLGKVEEAVAERERALHSLRRAIS